MFEDMLCIDARMFESGIGVYTYNLMRELHTSFAVPIHGLTHTDRVKGIEPFCQQVTVVNSPIYSLREQLSIASATRSVGLLHVPHYNIPLLYKGRLLVTIHDLTHILDKTYKFTLKSKSYGAPMLRIAAMRASHIFTVSEYSKRNIIRELGVSETRISVVYNGVDKAFSPGDRVAARHAVKSRFGIDRSFFLYVGNLKPHKNVATLVEAYSRFLDIGGRTHDLVVVGSGDDGKRFLQKLATKLGVTVRFVKDATTAELPDLYRAADVMVQPSFEEGFGLTVLEAMACGTPVLASNTGALPEIAAGGANYFPPNDPAGLAEALASLISSPALCATLCERGVNRASAFTWQKVAERHLKIYQEFLSA